MNLHEFIYDYTTGVFHTFDSLTMAGLESYPHPEAFLNRMVKSLGMGQAVIDKFGSDDFLSFKYSDSELEQIILWLSENAFIEILPVYTDGHYLSDKKSSPEDYIVGVITNYMWDVIDYIKPEKYSKEVNRDLFLREMEIHNAFMRGNSKEIENTVDSYMEYRESVLNSCQE